MRFFSGHVFPAHIKCTLRRLIYAGEQIKDRRLSCSVRTDQTDQLRFTDLLFFFRICKGSLPTVPFRTIQQKPFLFSLLYHGLLFRRRDRLEPFYLSVFIGIDYHRLDGISVFIEVNVSGDTGEFHPGHSPDQRLGIRTTAVFRRLKQHIHCIIVQSRTCIQAFIPVFFRIFGDNFLLFLRSALPATGNLCWCLKHSARNRFR